VPGDDHDDHADGQDQDVAVLQDDVGDVARGEQRPVGEHANSAMIATKAM
jgi:hypothetical protein